MRIVTIPTFFIFFICSTLGAFALTDTLSPNYCDKNSESHHFGELREDVCAKVNSTTLGNLSFTQQKYIMLNIFTQQGVIMYPLQQFVNQWNNKMPLANAPAELEQQSLPCRDQNTKNCINQAWFAIGGIDDSFVYQINTSTPNQKTTYIPQQGRVHTFFNYSMSSPDTKGYVGQITCASTPLVSIPSSDSSHCGFTFSHQDQTQNFLYRSDIYQDDGGFTLEYSNAMPTDQLRATLDIQNKIKVTVYDWQNIGTCQIQRCSNGRCRYFTENKYQCLEHTSYFYIEHLSLAENWNISTLNSYPLEYELFFQDPQTNPKVTFTTSIPEYRLLFGKSIIHKSNYKYEPRYRYPPYNYLYLERVDSPFVLKSDVTIHHRTNNTITFSLDPNHLGSCKLEVLHPFGKTIHNCSQTQNSTYTPKIAVKLNQSLYDYYENIQLNVTITSGGVAGDGLVFVTYNNQTTQHLLEQGLANLTLNHIAGVDKIEFSYLNYTQTVWFHSYNKFTYWSLIWLLFIITFLILIYKSIEHYTLRKSL